MPDMLNDFPTIPYETAQSLFHEVLAYEKSIGAFFKVIENGEQNENSRYAL